MKSCFPQLDGRGRMELTFARFVPVPEARSALAAMQRLAADVGSQRSQRVLSPLFLHGPAGTGKTHLAAALIEDVLRRAPQFVASSLSASDFAALDRSWADTLADQPDHVQAARQSDLLVVDDVQHLPVRAAETFVQLFDYRQARRLPMVFVAAVAPRQLTSWSARLLSRLTSGLVVGIEPLSVPSRLALLRDKAQRRQLAVHPDVLTWLAEHLPGGGRQLEGALAQLELLAQLHEQPLDVATVAAQFREQADAGQPTVERIVQRVGNYFQVEPRQLQSQRRHRSVLLPRQIGMYLARQLTGLSLQQIGVYFGGRDHSTVLHACQKVAQALERDAVLSGVVRHLHADLA